MDGLLQIFILCLTLASSRSVSSTTDVDSIEVNHTPHFTQVILWKWSHDYNRNDCVGFWVTNSEDNLPSQVGGFFIARSRGKVYRSKQFVESWTQNDLERENAKLFPQELRP